MGRRSRAMEFYRFASAVLILCYHCYFFHFRSTGTSHAFATSYLLVELFFILSGFLMYRGVRKMEASTDPVGETLAHTKGRLARLYPHHLFSWLVVAAISLFVTRELTAGQVIRYGWPELLLVNIFGFVRGQSVNIVCWYLSGLTMATLLVYYLLRRDEKLFINILAPVLLVFLYGMLYDGKQSLASTIIFVQRARFYGFFRSLADLCAGCLAWRVYEAIEGRSIRHEAAWATLYEMAVFTAVALTTVKKPGYYDFYYVLLFFGFVISVFRGQSIFSRLLDNRLSDSLGKMSYAYFLNNLVVILPYRWLFPEEENVARMCLICAVSCGIFSFFSTWFVEKCRRWALLKQKNA